MKKGWMQKDIAFKLMTIAEDGLARWLGQVTSGFDI
jgi:hypothetical protein